MKSRLLASCILVITTVGMSFCSSVFADAAENAAARAKAKALINSVNQAAAAAKTAAAKRNEQQVQLFSNAREEMINTVTAANEKQRTLETSMASAPPTSEESNTNTSKTKTVPTPVKKTEEPKEPKKLSQCTCNDNSSDYNSDVNNFLYDRNGNRIQRVYPACVCTDVGQAQAAGPSETTVAVNTSSTDKSKDKEKSSGFQIPY